MTPERLKKIRALANDARGDPNLRAVARRKLEFYQETPSKVHPGLKPSADFERWRFGDVGSWRRNSHGNPLQYVVCNGALYRVALIPRKGKYGWVARDAVHTHASSEVYSSLHEASQGAWEWLKTQ